MPNSIFDARPLRDEKAAYAYVEAKIWRNGRVCPHCGVIDRSGLLKGKSTRIGVYKCYACRKPFTVKIGTIFEDSALPLDKWFVAIWAIANCKNGISSYELARSIGVHRICTELEELEQTLDRLGGLRADLQPVLCPVGVDLDEARLFLRVVLADRLDGLAIPTGTRVGNDDPVVRRTDLAKALELDLDGHGCGYSSVLSMQGWVHAVRVGTDAGTLRSGASAR